jgi:hypothetical protein
MEDMEKDYLEQLQTVEEENEKLKLSIREGNELLSQCQRALTLASQKSTTLAVMKICICRTCNFKQYSSGST